MFNGIFQLLNLCDGRLAPFLPDVLRVSLWGALCGVAALVLYAVVSNQERIATLKREARGLRRQMRDISLTYEDMMQLNKQNLLASLQLLGHTIWPAMLSSVPSLLCMLWMSLYQTYALPTASTPIRVTLVPETSSAVIDSSPIAPEVGINPHEVTVVAAQRLRVVHQGQTVYAGIITNPPMGSVHKRHWWNTLLEAQAGYIDAEAPIDEIVFDFPRKRLTASGPIWLATWEFPFFFGLMAAAFATKRTLQIE